jgi:CDP-diacylglycerol--glycerol-3-phosphate 3-phosphatidyltransferase
VRLGYADAVMTTTPPTGKRKAFALVLAMTLARVPLAILFALLFALTDHLWARAVAGVALLTAMELSDAYDGHFARKYGVVTEWGAMLDPYTDSVSRLIVFWTLAASGYALWLTVLVMAVRDVTVSYCRVTLTRYGRTVKAKRSGKIKAIVQAVAAITIVLAPVVDPWVGTWIYPALSWIVILVTAASAVEYVRAAVACVGDGAQRPAG